MGCVEDAREFACTEPPKTGDGCLPFGPGGCVALRRAGTEAHAPAWLPRLGTTMGTPYERISLLSSLFDLLLEGWGFSLWRRGGKLLTFVASCVSCKNPSNRLCCARATAFGWKGPPLLPLKKKEGGREGDRQRERQRERERESEREGEGEREREREKERERLQKKKKKRTKKRGCNNDTEGMRVQ